MSAQGDVEARRDEAAAQSDLGALLQKPRGERAQASVAEILQREAPTPDKVREIRRIDARAELDEHAETVAQPLTRPLAAIKSIIKTPHTRASYFDYMLRQHARVRAFARRSHVLEVTPLPPCLRMSPTVQKPFREQLQPLAEDLLRLCDRALEAGWNVLERGDYNLVVLLKRLCFEVMSVNFRVLDYRDRDLADSLRSLETYFLVLHYRDDYPPRVVSALQASLTACGASAAEGERAAMMASTLLGPDLALPSLHDFVLGLNVVKVRRPLRLEDVIFGELGEILNTRDFACPPSVHVRIGEHVESLQKQIFALNKQQSEVEHLRRVLPLDATGIPDFGPLASLYDGSSRQGASFAADCENLMALAPRLLAAFDATFAPLLTGRIRLSDGVLIALFPQDLFATYLQRLRQTAANFAKLGFRLRVMTRARLLILRNTSRGAVAAEADTLQQIDEAVRLLMDIAPRVEEVLSSPLRRADLPVRESASPLIAAEREFSLPCKEQRIVSRDSLRGKAVQEALSFLVAVCYSAAAFFVDRPILLTLERGSKITEKLSQTHQELERLAEPQA